MLGVCPGVRGDIEATIRLVHKVLKIFFFLGGGGGFGVFIELIEICFVIVFVIVFYVFEAEGLVVKQNWQYPN